MSEEKKELPKILVVVGPTCSGKTRLGIALAKEFGGEVIAADSRTVYREMDIGTAKPVGGGVERASRAIASLERSAVALSDGSSDSHAQLAQDVTIDRSSGTPRSLIETLFAERPRLVEGIPHWGMDLVNPDELFTVSDFQEYADRKIGEILGRGNVPILVGGTGLYVRAVLDRPNFGGAVPSKELREEIEKMTDNELLEEIAGRDPDAAASIDDRNRRRLVRALEILRTTGGTLAEHQEFGDPLYDALQFGLMPKREDLYAAIDLRVDEMIGGGLIDEVRRIREKYGDECYGMSGIGYRQILDFFNKKEQLRDAVMRIKYDTHHYARRQETWFKKDARILWVTSVDEAVKIADTFLKR